MFVEKNLKKPKIEVQASNFCIHEQKGYIQKLNNRDLEMNNEKIWYLPVFPVINPKKPEKVRLVWDAAASVNGVSLNSFLLTGPDFLVPLIGVLYRFREKCVAMCADIKEMYHQIKIKEIDQQSQRFLWPNANDDTITDVYVICSECHLELTAHLLVHNLSKIKMLHFMLKNIRLR